MIKWTVTAIEKMEQVLIVTTEKSGIDAADEATIEIVKVANTLDQPMNLSRPRKSRKGARERLVDVGSKKNEFIIIFEDDGKGNIKILTVKHYLEK